MSAPAVLPEPENDLSELLGPELASALAGKGYTSLTPVQRSVLDPELLDRDLRISSQTGSGKTLAIGFALRPALSPETLARSKVARPQALVIVPTRELCRQVHDELSWLYAPLKLRVAPVAGGASYRDEHRALASSPAIVVGTPGRLLDHLNRGAIEAEDVAAVVLDEADRMLDLGFRDELEAILAKAPEGHRTHLVSATFPRDVAALADRVQQQPRRIEGTPLGSANRDIDHIVYLVEPAQRVDALVNVLLHHEDEQTLVFARTRADVAEIARELQQAGFASGALSGEMSQDQRNRALSAFKSGSIRALIATDVAARGIDVQGIARVIQVDPPSDPDTYTHRSGRTGRAGRKGVSAVLVAPAGLKRAAALFGRARIQFRIEPVPTAAEIRAAQDARWLSELAADDEREVPERVQRQVQQILERGLTERALTRLIIGMRRALGEPREVTPYTAELPQKGSARQREQAGARFEQRGRGRHFEERRFGGSPARPDFRAARGSDSAPARSEFRGYGDSERPPRRDSERPSRRDEGAAWVPFRVSWGEAHGADARRLVAMLCRRGNVRGSDIGAIRVSRVSSTVEVAAHVAAAFEAATREPDPRDPRVQVTPLGSGPPARPSGPQRGFEAPAPRAARPQRAFESAAPRTARPQRGFEPSASRAARPQRAFESAGPRTARPQRGFEAEARGPQPAADLPPKRPGRKLVIDASPPRKKPKPK